MEPTDIIFKPYFFNEDLVNKFTEEIEWDEKTNRRMECFMADETLSYNYDGKNTYYSKPFHPKVKEIMDTINSIYNCNLDICFLNLYKDQFQALNWHADDSPEIDQSEPIAVVSFGSERKIWVKPKDYKGQVPDEWKFSLPNGSLFLMPMGYQDDFFHKIPKNPEPCSTRISLTFRKYKK